MFASYAALVKNLRGVVLLDRKEKGIEKTVRWFGGRFKYRQIGVPPSLHDFEHLKGGPFVPVTYPTKSLRDLARLAGTLVRPEAAEAVVLASAHVCPVMALGKSWELLRPLAVGEVMGGEMDARSLKLHLRISDYTVLDLYQWSTENSRRLWRGEGLGEERARRVERDKKRYWRLKEGKKPFLLYLDLARKLSENPRLLKELLELPEEEVTAGLAILSAVVLEAPG